MLHEIPQKSHKSCCPLSSEYMLNKEEKQHLEQANIKHPPHLRKCHHPKRSRNTGPATGKHRESS